MFKSITMNDREMGMLANAASPLLYKSVFKTDLLQEIQKMDPNAPDVGLVMRLAFILSMQADKKKVEDFRKLTEDDFIEWLEQFEPFELIEHGNDIMQLYAMNTKSTSIPKKGAE